MFDRLARMGRWNSRRAGPDHPRLFDDARDIPVPLEPPSPRAREALAPYAAVLAAADATTIEALGLRHAGQRVIIGGERRPADRLLGGDALLDDGSAVLPVRLAARAPQSLRAALAARFVLVSGVLRAHEGSLALEPDEVVDLRAVARDLGARR